MKTSNLLSNIANSKFMTNHIEKCKNPKFIARTLLLTSVSKDVFAYGLRVKNTLENDRIPEDKKKFSAHMDLASGIITAIVQTGVGFLMSNENFQDSISNKLFNSIKDNKRAFKAAKTSFSAISTLVAATLFAKRMLTPIIANKIVYKLDHKNDVQKSPQIDPSKKTPGTANKNMQLK